MPNSEGLVSIKVWFLLVGSSSRSIRTVWWRGEMKFRHLRLETKIWPLEIECSTTFDRALWLKSLRSRNLNVYCHLFPFPFGFTFPFAFPFSLFDSPCEPCIFAIATVAWLRALMVGMSKQLCWTTVNSIFRSEFAVDCASSILAMRAETAVHWPRVNHDLSVVGRPADFVWASAIFFKCLDESV